MTPPTLDPVPPARHRCADRPRGRSALTALDNHTSVSRSIVVERPLIAAQVECSEVEVLNPAIGETWIQMVFAGRARAGRAP